MSSVWLRLWTQILDVHRTPIVATNAYELSHVQAREPCHSIVVLTCCIQAYITVTSLVIKNTPVASVSWKVHSGQQCMHYVRCWHVFKYTRLHT